jgi:hypothetical protein
MTIPEGLLMMALGIALLVIPTIIRNRVSTRSKPVEWGPLARYVIGDVVMGRLLYPFLAGSAALIILGLVISPALFRRSYESGLLMPLGILIGVLASVVLYAVMRAIVERGEK